VRLSVVSSRNDIICSNSLTTSSGGSASGRDVDLPSAGAIAYPEHVALIIDDQLPAGLIAGGITLLRSQIPVEDIGGE